MQLLAKPWKDIKQEVKEELSKDAHMEVKKESNEAAVDAAPAGGNEVPLEESTVQKLQKRVSS